MPPRKVRPLRRAPYFYASARVKSISIQLGAAWWYKLWCYTVPPTMRAPKGGCLIRGCFQNFDLVVSVVFVISVVFVVPQNAEFFRQRKTHKHKQICGIVPGLGGCQNYV